MGKIFVDKDLLEIIREIVNSLQKQFSCKGEDISFSDKLTSASEDLDDCFLYIGRLRRDMVDSLRGKGVIVVFEDRLEAELFEYFLELDVLGVFRKERLEIEFEEKGKLEKLLKDVFRNQHYTAKLRDGRYYQEIPYKSLHSWKFSVKLDDPRKMYESIKFVSIFLDPAMRAFSKMLRKVISDFRRAYAAYFPSYCRFSNAERDTPCRRPSEIVTSSAGPVSHQRLQKELEKCRKHLMEQHAVLSLPSLLIEGETGTGKTLIAEIIARNVLNDEFLQSHFKRIALVNIGKELVDSALFGHVKGAFTGADEAKLGIILENVFGVLFIDEIAEVPPDVQAKLLLYMDDYVVRPLGFDKGGIFAPVFLIAATNKKLQEEIVAGRFRSDLYHRFKYKLTIPPLRDRREDLRFLINFVLLNPAINPLDVNGSYAVNKISLEVISILENHSYPGNFRELEAILKDAVNSAIAEGLDIILPRHLKI